MPRKRDNFPCSRARQGAPTSVSRKADRDGKRHEKAAPVPRRSSSTPPMVLAASKAMPRSSSLFLKRTQRGPGNGRQFRIRTPGIQKQPGRLDIYREISAKKGSQPLRLFTFSASKAKTRAAEPHYIKPNRDGTGEPILYVAGLHKLSASKKNGRAARIEGKRPPMPCLKSSISIAASDGKPLIGFEVLQIAR